MPYILKVFRPQLDDAINALCSKIEERAEDSREELLGRMGYVVFEIEKRIMPELRYHSIAECSGILHNVPDEMCRRFEITAALYEGRTLIHDKELDPLIDALVAAILKTATEMLKTTSRGSTCEEVITVRPLLRLVLTGTSNYTLTTLALRITESHFQKKGFNLELLRQIPTLFKRVADSFYQKVAGPYENQQIQKPENSDLPEYETIRRRMRS